VSGIDNGKTYKTINGQEPIMNRKYGVLAAVPLAMALFLAGCSSDTSDTTTSPEPSTPAATPSTPATAPSTTGTAVTAGIWAKAVLAPPVGVCFFVSADGTTLTAGAECKVLEVEFEAVPGCPANGKLSIKASGDTPIEGGKAVVTDASGTATVTFNGANSATVVAGSDADPKCTYTFQDVTAGENVSIDK
jgi:hypothetical protein